MEKYLFTEEWNLGCPEKYIRIITYGKRTEREVDDICTNMEIMSNYDFTNPCIFDTKQEYLRALRARMDNGCKITDHEKEL